MAPNGLHRDGYKKTFQCPKCDSSRILHVPQVAERGISGSGDHVTMRLFPWRIAPHPNGGGHGVGDVEAYVCRECGYTEFYTTNLGALTDAAAEHVRAYERGREELFQVVLHDLGTTFVPAMPGELQKLRPDLDRREIAVLVARLPAVLAKSLPIAKAKQMERKLGELGMVASIEPDTSASPYR